MDTATLERLLAHYRAEAISEFSQITVGVSNEAYLVTGASGDRFVIRVIHLQTFESARAEALIQRALVRNGISTPVYLQLTSGEFVGRDGADTFTIARQVSGAHPESTTLKLTRSLGAALAKLHSVLDQDEIKVGYNTGQWLEQRNVAADIAKCDPSVRARLQPIVDATEYLFDEGLPMAVIHGELATNNVFAENDQVTTIFDFETTAYAPRILDVAYTFLSLVYDDVLEAGAVRAQLWAGYDSVATTPLTIAENDQFGTAVRYSSAACAAWCFSRGYDEYGEKFVQAGRRRAQ